MKNTGPVVGLARGRGGHGGTASDVALRGPLFFITRATFTAMPNEEHRTSGRPSQELGRALRGPLFFIMSMILHYYYAR